MQRGAHTHVAVVRLNTESEPTESSESNAVGQEWAACQSVEPEHKKKNGEEESVC